MAVYTNDASLEALYRLENDWTDTSANGNDLGPVNTPTFNNVDFRQGAYSVDLEASSFQRAAITDAGQTGLDITGSISFGAWLKMESAGTDRTIISKYLTTGDQRSYWLRFSNAAGAIAVVLSPNGTSGSAVEAVGATNPGTGAWVHVVAVYNGTDIRIYINGSLDSNGSNNPLSYSSGIFNGSADFAVGARGTADLWDGLLDEIFVFSRALSASEVADIYANHIQDPPAGQGKLLAGKRNRLIL